MPHLFIADPNLRAVQGHYYGYASRIGRAAAALGVDFTILAASGLTIAGDPHLVPCFSQDYWHEMSSTDGVDPYVHIERSAGRFADELGASLREHGAGPGDALFLPCANLVELEGVARLANRNLPLPRCVLLFRRELEEQGLEAGVGPRIIAALHRRALAMLTNSAAGARVRLFTDSDALTDEYAERLHNRVQTAPIPVDPLFTALAGPRADGPIVISYFGDARLEKGYQRLPRIADTLTSGLESGRFRLVVQSNFNVPGGEPGIAAARDSLAGRAGVEILDEPLSDDAYAARLGASHLVLLPYEPQRYVSRTSGILAEAIHAGVPMVVPDGTWMSDQLRVHGAGAVYDGWHDGTLSGAVIDAIERLPTFLARASARRGGFVAFHNPSRMARFVCGAAITANVRSAA